MPRRAVIFDNQNAVHGSYLVRLIEFGKLHYGKETIRVALSHSVTAFLREYPTVSGEQQPIVLNDGFCVAGLLPRHAVLS